ncbi:MAG: HlyD family efflux transporter periplasmic adaptor subunit [Gammaproteobacteria bacterium]|nr:HlyD family efflux transporter periplasmic adaptor subunit [Gammaproteobacteria bacterium]
MAYAEERLGRYRDAATSGAVSRADLLLLESELASGEVQLKHLERTRFSLVRTLRETREKEAALVLALAARESNIAIAHLELKSRALTDDLAAGEVVVAPIDGRVMSLPARQAAEVQMGRELVVLAPTNAPLVAELLIPLRAMGLVEAGQSVALRYDALPFHQFGTFEGIIESVAQFVSDGRDFDVAASGSTPVFRALARPLAQPHDAQAFVLKAGMTVTADIGLKDVTVLHWILEPLLRLQHGPLYRAEPP